MKKVFVLAAVLAAVCLCSTALCQEAEDITAQCVLQTSHSKHKAARLTDRDFGTQWSSSKERNPYVELTAPEGKLLYGIYVCFGDKLIPWEAQTLSEGEWTPVQALAGDYAHEYVPLDGVKSVRVTPQGNAQTVLSIGEIFALGSGDTPDWVQVWQPAPEKADLLLLAAHPDDELLFFGGAIPYYAGELGKNVMVAYMTCGTFQRRSELLNGLWACGLRSYPDIGDFWDKYATKLDKGYEAWGKNATYQRITGVLRRYKPDVVVTHDVNGEYGHAGHKVCADALIKCVDYASDSGKYSASFDQYGVWQVKKAYLHLYGANAVEMDWDVPLTAFGGKTGYEVAAEAYTHHTSQQTAGQKNKQTGKFEYFVVEPQESDYSCYRFGLAFTAVGPDALKNDFFENIP